ncbi:MAG: nucleotidyltransferase family protein [Chloroflexi bacterium]|nr:nucleotidyltransferase family protein [Chloroflexota bacterium]
MNALLLAAGYATRLYPLTLDTPKPLLSVAGKPIAQYMVDQLDPIAGLRRLLVVTNRRFAGRFESWAAAAPSRFTIEVVDDESETNETRLGAIGDIAFTLARFPALAAEPLFVLGGDNLVDFRLADLVETFQRRGGDATVIALVRTLDPAQLRRSGVVTLDDSGRVMGFVEKPADPPSDLTCPPFYVFPPAALALVPTYLAAGEPADAPGNLIAWLHRHAPVFGHVFAEERYDVGTPESYAAACRLFEARAAARHDG